MLLEVGYYLYTIVTTHAKEYWVLLWIQIYPHSIVLLVTTKAWMGNIQINFRSLFISGEEEWGMRRRRSTNGNFGCFCRTQRRCGKIYSLCQYLLNLTFEYMNIWLCYSG